MALWDGQSNRRQVSTIADARRDAHGVGLPLVLEPLPRGLDPYGAWVIEWARAHASSGADLYKLPYPGSPSACREVSALLDRPWALLSAGVSFETFLPQLEAAIGQGASGYIVGRAVWREAATLDRDARSQAIDDHVVPRLQRLADVSIPARTTDP